MFLDEPLIWLWALLSSNGSPVVYPEATCLPSQGGPERQGCACASSLPSAQKVPCDLIENTGQKADISRGDEERGLASGLHPMF